MFPVVLYMYIWRPKISVQLSLVTFTEIYSIAVSFIFFFLIFGKSFLPFNLLQELLIISKIFLVFFLPHLSFFHNWWLQKLNQKVETRHLAPESYSWLDI